MCLFVFVFCVRAYVWFCFFACLCVRVHVCLFVHACVCMCVRVCVFVFVHVSVVACLCLRACLCIFVFLCKLPHISNILFVLQVEHMHANNTGRMLKKRKQMKLSSAGSSATKKLKLTTTSLTSKKLKLVKKSKMDVMMRRQRNEIINEIKKYKDDEVKKIDSEVRSMKRDLLAYMLKEIEEHKRVMVTKMEEGIEEERTKRLNLLELKLLSKVCNDKSIQTVNCPETIDEKYEEILIQLKDIKHTSNLCKNLLTKQSSLRVNNTLKRLHNPSPSLNTSSLFPKSQAEDSIHPQPSIQHTYHSNIADDQFPRISDRFDLQSSSKEGRKKNISMEDNSLSGENFASYSHNEACTYGKKFPLHSPKNSILNHRYRSLKENNKLQLNNQHSSQEDTDIYNHSLSLHCQDNIPYNKNLASDDNATVYIMVPEEDNPSKQTLSSSREVDSSYLHSLSQQNVLETNKNSMSPPQNTALYIKNLLSADENSSLCNQPPNIPEENTASYIKDLLISSQLDSSEGHTATKIKQDTSPYGKNTYYSKPTLISSQDTALYIKNLLMTSHDHASPKNHNSTLQKNTSNIFNKSSPIPSLENASHYNKTKTKQNNESLIKKNMSFPNTKNTAYNIYTYNKKLISSQENNMLYNRNMDDIATLTVRKKREINKRIYEKYGPLHNHKEICETVKLDPIFLSLSLMERNGILSCITRSVAEHLTFSKDLLEELFSREVLSISSCKGSPIKTALNADKLSFIRKVVFTALPSDDEEAVWEMIQDCIDTKCRGILRNMKKKLSKQSFESFEC